ncbi:MAG: bifunctional precorrin-2 dehydrogenase/sirohydrochlorin ferrochelatase [Armatimonadetes bacterium]|nr:bifunctional precorrin-2 dehydrogenase/sirohydrochlorin ferrochelatase [Armatimonadota bacterium]
MPHYPVNLDLRGRKCIVVGGGNVAERKVRVLLDFDANVIVVAPQLTIGLEEMADAGKIEHINEPFRPEFLQEAFLAIAATDDRETNSAVSSKAQELGVLVNVVDDPELCTFLVPAIVRRGNVVISISTSGKSPILAKQIKEKVESCIGPEYQYLADMLGALRDEIKAKYEDSAERKLAYQRILDSEVLDLLAQGKHEEAFERARKCI